MTGIIDRTIKDMKQLNETGAASISGEMQFREGRPAPFSEWWFRLDDYLTARLLWNPDQSAERIVQEYCNGLYGEAGEDIRKLFSDLEKLYMKNGPMSIIPKSDAQKMNDTITAAEKKAKNKALDRVKEIRKNFILLSSCLKKYAELENPQNVRIPDAKDLCLRLNKQGKLVDTNGKNIDVSMIGMKLADSPLGKALELAPEDGAVVLHKPIPLTGNYTFSAWFKLSDIKVKTQMLTDSENIVQPRCLYGSKAVNNRFDELSLSLRKRQLWMHDNSAGNLRSAFINFSSQKWYHIVSVVDRDKQEMVLYVDGKLAGVNPAIKSAEKPIALSILGASGGISGQKKYRRNLGGSLAALRVYTRALDSGEILGLYENEVKKIPQNLLHDYSACKEGK